MRIITKAVTTILFLAFSSITLAATGPIILGGDDLDDHGSRAGAVNITGWAYGEAAATSILAQETAYAGVGITVDIVAIGPTDPGIGVYPSGNSGGMVNSVANVLGKTVTYLNTVAAINTFFTTDLGTTVKPRMIWIVSNQASNDLSAAAEIELATHGAALNTFQQNGGGILSHVHGYGWLNVLVPGVTLSASCGNPVSLTTLGSTSFPTITNANVDSGPCHTTFGGNLGGLGILAKDPSDRNVIIGGAAGVTIAPTTTGVPTLSFWGLLLMTTLLGIIGSRVRRRKH